ncbi:cupredoxin domain-containing protein [Candidatus Woesearchaeota archaeon]|nr:cupredoxin domain-containing protein [Candidatus Woesearchaeota archaeon]
MKVKTLWTVFFCFIIFVFLIGCKGKEEQQPPTISEEEAKIPAPEVATVTTTEDSASKSQVKELTVQAYNWGFTVDPVKIKKGDTVKLKLVGVSGTHGFALPEFDVNAGPIGEGSEQTIEFVADQAGTFTYYCNVPCGKGHKEMKGELVVEE